MINKEEKILNDIKNRFLEFDQNKMIEIFDLKHDDDNLYMDFLGRQYRIDRKTADAYKGDIIADSNEMASIYEILTLSESRPSMTGTWASIAQLCTNTTDTSLTRYVEQLQPFEGKMALLQEACVKLGGTVEKKGDVSSIIPVFEGVDVWFQYWEADDEFPASVQFLWDKTIVNNMRWAILWDAMTCITRRLKEEAGL